MPSRPPCVPPKGGKTLVMRRIRSDNYVMGKTVKVIQVSSKSSFSLSTCCGSGVRPDYEHNHDQAKIRNNCLLETVCQYREQFRDFRPVIPSQPGEGAGGEVIPRPVASLSIQLPDVQMRNIPYLRHLNVVLPLIAYPYPVPVCPVCPVCRPTALDRAGRNSWHPINRI